MKIDKIYKTAHNEISDFEFDESVANVFDDMLDRSVPGYRTILSMLTTLSHQYAKPNTNVFDLGCSLGNSTLALKDGLTNPTIQFIAIDNSHAMVTKARQRLDKSVTIKCSDIRDAEIENASIIVLNFTLQFIPIDERINLLTKISKGMNSNGVLVLSEKIAFTDPQIDRHMIELHQDFKRSNGYTEIEINQKRSALENILKPEPIHTHIQRLKSVGFKSVETWFQCFNFASMIAFK